MTIGLIFMTISPSAGGFPDGLLTMVVTSGSVNAPCRRDSRPLCQAERLTVTLYMGEGVASAGAQRPPSFLRIGHPGKRLGIALECAVGGGQDRPGSGRIQGPPAAGAQFRDPILQ